MILNWLRRRVFNQNRLIFTFFDGQTSHRVDPLEVWFALRVDPELILTTHLPLVEESPEGEGKLLENGRVEAWQIVGRATGRAFKLAEGRMTIWERRQLLLAFLAYLDGVKKNSRVLPISLPPMVRRFWDASTTNAESASTSTPVGPNPAAPEALPLASP